MTIPGAGLDEFLKGCERRVRQLFASSDTSPKVGTLLLTTSLCQRQWHPQHRRGSRTDAARLARVSAHLAEISGWQGIGNVASGLLGGLPITSVVVRSSVNIHAGAHSKLSTIIHGVFLLASVLLISPLMNHIPLASLAAILLVAGYRLANVGLFKEMYAKGLNQFIPFLATLVAIVFTDLLTGIIIGSGISIFYLLKSNLVNPFTVVA